MTDIQKESRAVALWLFGIAAMVMIMAIIGAITRLTESGLSIVEWKPFTGAIPPLSDADWLAEFQKYQTSPQYLKVNLGMSLDEFKNIFWWEWIHRQWGRLIGLVYAIGFIVFLLRNSLTRHPGVGRDPDFESRKISGLGPALRRGDVWKHLTGILILGLLQGLMGWLMVTSGLVHDPAVSHYRLAAHLVLAVALYLWSLWLGLKIRGEKREARGENNNTVSLLASRFSPLYRHSIAALGMVVITLIWGAFTAGLRAGLIYNSWPLMDGHWTPDSFWHLSPWWKNYFENHGVVQYVHRTLGYVTSLMCISIGIVNYVRKVPPPARAWGYAVCAMGFVQPALGIITVLTQVKLHPAVTHQAGAFVLMGLLVVWIKKLGNRS